MKALLLAGGSGSRLYPLTKSINKHLLAVHDKPMIYYPLCSLMLAGVRDILIVCTPQDKINFQQLLADGEQFGIRISYACQAEPNGIADALLLAEEFIANEPIKVMLGDNILYGQTLSQQLQQAFSNSEGATIFAYRVSDPSHYGVVELDSQGCAISIEEKPQQPKSRFAVIGLYCFSAGVIELAKQLKPSARGELEITDLNRLYLENKQLNVHCLGRGITWFDAGTFAALHEASQFIRLVETRQWLKIGAPEEVAWRMNYINDEQLLRLANKAHSSDYGKYLLDLTA